MTSRSADPAAVEWYNEFAYREYPHAVALARRLLLDARLPIRDADDIVQEAFLAAFQKLALVYVHPNQRGWIFKTVHLLFRNHCRKMARTLSDVSIEDCELSSTTTPEDIVLIRDLIDGAAQRLSPREHELYERVYLHDQTAEQIAHQSGQRADTVMRQISRMNEKLRKLIISLSENATSRHIISERSSQR